MPLQAGKLDRRVRLMRPIKTTDGFGGKVVSYEHHATVWASYSPVSDGERQRASETGSVITARFQVRFSSVTAAVTPEFQLEFEGRTHNIQGVKEIGRREGVEISAVARTDLA